VIIYALLDSRDENGSCALGDAIDLYVSRATALSELRGIVSDEPEWQRFVSVVEIELDAGCLN
jgi:hypothetical protein